MIKEKGGEKLATLGSEKQEKKLNEFANLAKKIFPDINELPVKGALRYGANAAIEKSPFSHWEEIAEQPVSVRRKFFHSLLQEARPHLIHVIGEEKVDGFIEKVKVENEKYLKD
jgi:hypothetical protein